jgi:transcriptional regulator with XRE-family HTH domain
MATTTDRTTALGREVRDRRERLGWSRETLARQADVSSSTVARLELYGQEPSLRTISALAASLECDVADLLAKAS